MKSPAVEGEEVKLILDTRLYGQAAILQAAKDYLDSCWVLMDGSFDDKILITLKPKNREIKLKTLGFEFCNYVLGLMQNAIY